MGTFLEFALGGVFYGLDGYKSKSFLFREDVEVPW